MIKRSAFLLLFCSLAFAGTLSNDERDYRRGYEYVLDENWYQATKYFDTFLKRYPGSSWSDDASFWICYARAQDDDFGPAAAFECFVTFLERWPKSDWADDARRRLATLATLLDAGGRSDYTKRLRKLSGGELPVSKDQRTLMAILSSLADIGDETSVNTILSYIETDDEFLRERLVLVLEDMEGPRVTAKLTEMLRSDPSDRVRMLVLEAIEDREDDGAINQAVLAIFRDVDLPRPLRMEALGVLAERAAEDHLDLFAEVALKEDDLDMAEAALDALEDVPSEKVTRTLIDIYQASNRSEVKLEVLDALGDQENAQARDFLFSIAMAARDEDTVYEAVEELADFEAEAPRLLREVLDRAPTTMHKLAAIEALGDLDTSESLTMLRGLLAGEQPLEIDLAVVDAMGESDNPQVVDILVELAAKQPRPELQEAVAEALGDIGTPEARDALLKMLKERLQR